VSGHRKTSIAVYLLLEIGIRQVSFSAHAAQIGSSDLFRIGWTNVRIAKIDLSGAASLFLKLGVCIPRPGTS